LQTSLVNGLQFVGPSDQEVAEPLRGYGLGEVVESKNSQFQVGELVFGISITWDTYSLQKNPSKDMIIVPQARELAQQGKVPLSAYMGILGMPGLTGYQSLELYGNLKAGQTIFVSSAAGYV
jgi:NADPH-dependent curcumin reductase CurA